MIMKKLMRGKDNMEDTYSSPIFLFSI